MGGVQVINGQIDIFAISFFEEEKDISLYRVAFQLSMIVSFGLHAVTMFVAPQISALYYSNKVNELRALVFKSTVFSIFISFPAVIFIAFFGSELIAVIFGDEYSLAYISFFILSFSQLLGSLFGPQVTLLNACGFEKSVFRVTILCVLLNIFLNFILVPIYSIEGAAIATLISQVVRSFILLESHV